MDASRQSASAESQAVSQWRLLVFKLIALSMPLVCGVAACEAYLHLFSQQCEMLDGRPAAFPLRR